MRTLARVVVCWVVLGTVAGRAHADDLEGARAAFTEGTRYYDLGEYRSALGSFKTAYLKWPNPGFLYNLAQCHRELGERAEALRFYRTYLQLSPDLPDGERADVKAKIAELEATPARPPEPAVSTQGPAGAALSPKTPAATEHVAPIVTATSPAHATATATASHGNDAAPLAADPPSPLYRRWWLWTAIAGLAVVAAGVSVGVALASRSAAFTPTLADFQTALTGRSFAP